MSIDVGVAALVIAFLVLGWRGGALRQAVRVLGAVAVVFASPAVARLLREVAGRGEGAMFPGEEAVFLVGAAAVIYTSVSLGGWLAIRVLRATSPALSTVDRMAGAGLGVARGVLIGYFLVFVFLWTAPALARVDPDDRLHLRDGQVMGFVESNNLLAPWHLPRLVAVHRLVVSVRTARDEGRQDVLRQEPYAAELARDERVRALVEDEDFLGFVRNHAYPVTLCDARVRTLLNDPEVVDKLDSADWSSLEEQLGGSEPAPPVEDGQKKATPEDGADRW